MNTPKKQKDIVNMEFTNEELAWIYGMAYGSRGDVSNEICLRVSSYFQRTHFPEDISPMWKEEYWLQDFLKVLFPETEQEKKLRELEEIINNAQQKIKEIKGE